jgi:hypothetical protein
LPHKKYSFTHSTNRIPDFNVEGQHSSPLSKSTVVQKLETNWDLMKSITDTHHEKRIISQILCRIEEMCQQFPNSEAKQQIIGILSSEPNYNIELP